MIEWSYAIVNCKCGRCDAPIWQGDRMAQIPIVKRKLVRCEACGQEYEADRVQPDDARSPLASS